MGEFENAYRQLNAEQKQAVDTIDGPVLVVAGPGTGKTQLLTARVANILKKTDSSPQNILCLTYTDAAAHTMRQRLANLIGQEAYDVTISTYHAFGSELIRRYPEYFLDGNEERPIDDLGADTVLRRIVDNLPFANPLRYAGTYLRDVKTLISDFKRALLTPKEIVLIADQNEAFIRQASKMTQKHLKEVIRIDKHAVAKFQKLAEDTRTLVPTTKFDGVKPLAVFWQEELEEALADVEATGKTKQLTSWKNHWLAKNAENEFIAGGMQTNRKMAAAAGVYRAYLDELRRQGLYDFDDMILRALRGLDDNPNLRFTLQEQYLYILLDEFQDTNEAQLKLVQLLTDNPASEGRPNILAVGDDDQAIYAFQGADYSHMLEFTRLYRDVLVVPLVRNYRSTPDILHVARNIATQVEERLESKFESVDKNLIAEAKPGKQTPKNKVARYEFKSDLAQFAWVTKEIASLIKNGISPGEIAVLAPLHRYLEPLVPYLQQADIPVRYEKRENILDDPIISQLMSMGDLVLALSRNDTAAANSLWPKVLSFECWQMPTTVIWETSLNASDNRKPWLKVMMDHAELRKIALFFMRLAHLSSTETLETMLDYLVGSQPIPLLEPETPLFNSPFYDCYFSQDKTGNAAFWDLLSNLTVLRQHLREYRPEQVTGLRLDDLSSFVGAHRAANIKILNTSPYAEAAQAVQLMTAYKAKGQEFSAVFVLGTQDEIWGTSARTGSSRLPLPPNLDFIRYGSASRDERLRLFFVAITRAKSHLYLTNYTSSYTGKLSSRLRFLNEIEQNGKIISQLLPEGQQEVQQTDTTPPQLHELSVYWQQRHVTPEDQVDARAILQPRLERYQLSPTHLNTFIDVIYGGPHAFFLGNMLRFPMAPSADSEYGSAVHEALQWSHIMLASQGKLPSLTALLNHFKQNLVMRKLSPTDTEQMLERGERALSAYYKQKLKTFQRGDRHEIDFRSEGVFVGGAHLTGKIDRLVINKSEKSVTIIDFKTGKSYKKWAAEPQLHKYRQQLYIYKLLIEHSHTFAGYKVEDAFLQFVEPDEEDNNINELHLEFEDSEMKQLQKLISVIWNHIMELNFPPIDGYPASLTGMKKFETDLIEKKI